MDSRDFIPTTLRFGTGLKMDLNEYNSLAFMFDITKLLVPTPPVYDSVGGILYGMDDNVSVMAGIIQSFYDAPGYDKNGIGNGPFMEELSEYNWALGVEYWYNNVFAVRGGYFNEAALKGNRKYFTLGAALKYNVFGLDVSYLIPIGSTVGVSPLENTLRFNLTYSISAKD